MVPNLQGSACTFLITASLLTGKLLPSTSVSHGPALPRSSYLESRKEQTADLLAWGHQPWWRISLGCHGSQSLFTSSCALEVLTKLSTLWAMVCKPSSFFCFWEIFDIWKLPVFLLESHSSFPLSCMFLSLFHVLLHGCVVFISSQGFFTHFPGFILPLSFMVIETVLKNNPSLLM